MTADIPVPNSNTQSHAQPVILVDKTTGLPYNASGGSGGGDGAILDGANATIKATVEDYTNSNPLAVTLKDTAGNYVSVGGGTQYNDGVARGSATGNLILGDDGTNLQSIHSDAAGDLQIDVLTLPSLVAGTANIGDVDVLTLPSIPAGTNNIGDVDVLSIAAGDNNIGNVDVLTLPALPAGTNNIGDIDVLTLPALPAGTNNIGDVDILSIAAGDNNIGNVDVVSMPTVTTSDISYTTAIEFSGANPVYVGEAVAGSAKSGSLWRIKKITYSGSNPIDVQYADGVSTFNKIWDNRASYSYS